MATTPTFLTTVGNVTLSFYLGTLATAGAGTAWTFGSAVAYTTVLENFSLGISANAEPIILPATGNRTHVASYSSNNFSMVQPEFTSGIVFVPGAYYKIVLTRGLNSATLVYMVDSVDLPLNGAGVMRDTVNFAEMGNPT